MIWQLWATAYHMPAFPPLSKVLLVWRDRIIDGALFRATADTLRVMFVGYAFAIITGITIGFLMGRVRVFWACAEPLVELFRQVPATALLPLFILYLGLGDTMKTSIVVLSATFPILINSYAGARSVSKTMKETAQTFQLTWWHTQWQIALPSSLPFIVVGLRQALSIALIMSIVTGMLAGNTGLGFYILEAQQTLNVTELFSGILTIAAIGYALNGVFVAIEHRYMRWRAIEAAS